MIWWQFSVVTNEELKKIKDSIAMTHPGISVKAWQIAQEVEKLTQTKLDESTIRGRFIEMGEPLSGVGGVFVSKTATPFEMPVEKTKRSTLEPPKPFEIPDDLKPYIPTADEFTDYVSRDIDKRLAIHYNIGPLTDRYKYPLTQGKQGTGKTYSHKQYAWKTGLPFFLYSCYEDFKLAKLYGDKTIKNGSIMFQESLFVKASQSPSVLLFDEINAISNANSFDFHALLQNRELFVKDANEGKGKVYKLHKECRIGFAQNPKSAKYIGGHIKPSNFLGRCTYLTYPEFKPKEIKEAIHKRFPQLVNTDLDNFTKYYFAVIEAIERSQIPVDVSIRQINNVIDLWLHGLELKDALEDGLSSILEAISQPKAKEAFFRIAQAIWKELM